MTAHLRDNLVREALFRLVVRNERVVFLILLCGEPSIRFEKKEREDATRTKAKKTTFPLGGGPRACVQDRRSNPLTSTRTPAEMTTFALGRGLPLLLLLGRRSQSWRRLVVLVGAV